MFDFPIITVVLTSIICDLKTDFKLSGSFRGCGDGSSSVPQSNSSNSVVEQKPNSNKFVGVGEPKSNKGAFGHEYRESAKSLDVRNFKFFVFY